MQVPLVSIIICTRNRARFLRETIAAIGQVRMPLNLSCELIIVDNCSTDDTAQMVNANPMPNMALRFLSEARPGKCFALNTGLAAAQGEIILFTDDDVRPPADWIEGMCRRLLSGEADAVAGGVRIAPALERAWMLPLHRAWLASTEDLNPNSLTHMIGANMAFSRTVLACVPAFDTELGPGALGFEDETLFSHQLLAAGCTIGSALDVIVEHHFDPSRLTRAAFLDMARKQGRSKAYVAHHWDHVVLTFPMLRLAKVQIGIGTHRRPRAPQDEGPTLREMQRETYLGFVQQYLNERRRPRNYALHGLVKLTQH